MRNIPSLRVNLILWNEQTPTTLDTLLAHTSPRFIVFSRIACARKGTSSYSKPSKDLRYKLRSQLKAQTLMPALSVSKDVSEKCAHEFVGKFLAHFSEVKLSALKRLLRSGVRSQGSGVEKSEEISLGTSG